MGQYNLHRILRPRKVAVIGASEKAGTIGNAVMKNLLEGGYAGQILPVNPKYESIHGLPTFRSVPELVPGVDLAVIATPIETVPEIVRDCTHREVGGAIIISAGGKEVGGRGLEIEQRISEIATGTGVRIIGPNCLGVILPGRNLNASFISGMPAAGNLAFVSQSGAICSAILDQAFTAGVGFSHFVSIGSMADVDFGDLVDYLGSDYTVKSILLYIESLTNFRKFMSAARAVSRVKPIIVLKAGRSRAGARAAASHTGAMVGEDAVYDAAFKRAGIVRVDTIAELFDCAEMLAKQGRPRGPRLAIVTNGGGPGVMAADYLARNGFDPTPLTSEILAQLDEVLPPCWSRNNPIDILGDATEERYRQVLQICLQPGNFDSLLLILAPQALTEPAAVAESVVEATKNCQCPILACWMGGRSIAGAIELFNKAGIPTFETPERAIRAFLSMVAFAVNQEMLLEVPPKLIRHLVFDKQKAGAVFRRNPAAGFLPEAEVREILAAYGLPVVRTEKALDEEQAVALSRSMGYPLVMKLCSPDITHKTEAGGVRLDLRCEADVRDAYRQIMAEARSYRPDARIEGVLLQPCLTEPDYEILLGAKRDSDFGPVIAFGMGGLFTEILQDRALGLPPMNRLLARRMMQQTKAAALLQGYRNRPPADFELLEEMILRLSQLLVDHPQVAELDLNPVLIKNGSPVVVDSRLLVSPVDVPATLHLVISPYPEEYEYRMVTGAGIGIFIRPVKPEDAPLFIDMFKVLSQTTIYYRFFGVLKELPPEMLARFTQIDYDREIALVAIDEAAETERMLGVARVIGDPDGTEGEFAVLVGDPWQGKGIGAGLLRRCMLIAAKRGFQNIHGVVLKENTYMLALGRKLGFMISKDEDSGEYELRFNFDRPDLLEAIAEP